MRSGVGILTSMVDTSRQNLWSFSSLSKQRDKKIILLSGWQTLSCCLLWCNDIRSSYLSKLNYLAIKKSKLYQILQLVRGSEASRFEASRHDQNWCQLLESHADHCCQPPVIRRHNVCLLLLLRVHRCTRSKEMKEWTGCVSSQWIDNISRS